MARLVWELLESNPPYNSQHKIPKKGTKSFSRGSKSFASSRGSKSFTKRWIPI